MTKSLSLSIVLVLLTISPVHIQAINYCANYILTTAYWDDGNNNFLSKVPGDDSIGADPSIGANLKNYATCSSINLDNFSWNLSGGYKYCKTNNKIGLGIWINFSKTVSTSPIMTFGNINGYPNTYRVTSTTERILTFSFTGTNLNSVAHSDDFTVTVSENEWIFLTFYWPGDSTFNVYATGQPVITKTAASSYAYAMPSDGKILLGKGITASIYQILGFFSVLAWTDNSIISVSDGEATAYATATCSVSCNDNICHPTLKCLSSASDCSDCNTIGCNTCATAGHDASDFCNYALVCDTICADCKSNNKCTQCNTGFFLADKADGSTTCIDCTTSCSSCNPGPSCFNCADSIVQDATTCRVDKIGYQLSVAVPNIEIDFAHPLSADITLGAISAKSNTGAVISTANWTLQPCAANSVTCIILTDNVSESILPIEIDFEFNKA